MFSLTSIVKGWTGFCLSPLSTLYSLPNGLISLSYRLIDIFSNLLVAVPSLLVFDNLNLVYNSYFTSQSSMDNSASASSGEVTADSSYSVYSPSLQSVSEWSSTSMNENSSDQRFMRFMNPVFRYDFKVGNYMPDDVKKLNPHLFMTIKDVTTGIRKSSWFTSEDYSRLLQSNFSSHSLYFADSPLYGPNAAQLTTRTSDLDSTYSANAPHSVGATPTGGFYNFFLVLSSSNDMLNTRWVAVNALDQKFYRMFATSSLQQRIHATDDH